MDSTNTTLESLYYIAGIATLLFVALTIGKFILFCLFPTSKFARGLRNQYMTEKILGFCKNPLFYHDPNKEPKEESDKSDDKTIQAESLKEISVVDTVIGNQIELGSPNSEVRRRILQDEDDYNAVDNQGGSSSPIRNYYSSRISVSTYDGVNTYDGVSTYEGFQAPLNAAISESIGDVPIDCHMTCSHLKRINRDNKLPTASYVDKLLRKEPDVRRFAMLNFSGYLILECQEKSHATLEKAAGIFEVVLHEAPNNLNALGNLLLVCRELNRDRTICREELETRYLSISQDDNFRGEALAELAVAFNLLRQHERDDPELPIRLYRQALDLGKRCPHLIRMDWKLSLGWYMVRLDGFTLGKDPTKKNTYFEQAEQVFKGIVSFNASDLEEKSGKARLKMFQARSWALLGELLSRNNGRKLRQFLEFCGGRATAKDCYLKAHRVNPGDTFVRDRVAKCLLQEDVDEAIKEFTDFLENTSQEYEKANHWAYFQCRGKAYSSRFKEKRNENDYDKAIRDLEDSYQLMNCCHVTCLYLADVYYLGGNLEKAYQWCQTSLSIEGGAKDRHVHELCARTCESLGLSEEAKLHWQKAGKPQEGQQNAVLESIPDSVMFDDVANSITNWKKMALQLGLTVTDIDCLINDYDSDDYRKIAMLDRWKQKFGDQATVLWLRDALKKANHDP